LHPEWSAVVRDINLGPVPLQKFGKFSPKIFFSLLCCLHSFSLRMPVDALAFVVAFLVAEAGCTASAPYLVLLAPNIAPAPATPLP